MPRRNVEQAQRIAAQRAAIRMRCVVRHPEFYHDLVKVRSCFVASEARNWDWLPLIDFLKKWGLKWFPFGMMPPNGELPRSPAYYERIISQAIKDEDIRRPMILPAVVAKDLFDDEYNAECIPKPGMFLHIRVDLSYPRDIIEKIIADHLKTAQARRARPEIERIHMQNLSSWLQVYDSANAGKSYSEIAESLQRSKSSIQHDDMMARRLIGDTRERRRVGMSAPLDRDAYVKGHLKGCDICRGAERFADYCDGFKSWTTDHMVPAPYP
jgi:hypothetical protein